MNPLKLLWSFYGRIGRAVYAGGLLLNVLLAAAAFAALVYADSGRSRGPGGPPPDPLVIYTFIAGFLLFTWAKLALAAKRFHDVGKTGWLCLLLFIPLVSLIAFIFLLAARGNEYDNRYGAGARSTGALAAAN